MRGERMRFKNNVRASGTTKHADSGCGCWF